MLTALLNLNSAKPSQDELCDYKEAFGIIDTDHDGKISKNDLRNFYRKLNMRITNEEIDRIFNKNTYITFKDFVCIAESQRVRHTKGEKPILKKTKSASIVTKETFNVFDINKDGKLSVSSIQHVMQKLGLDGISKDDLELLISDVDSDKDGKITYAEFKKLIGMCM